MCRWWCCCSPCPVRRSGRNKNSTSLYYSAAYVMMPFNIFKKTVRFVETRKRAMEKNEWINESRELKLWRVNWTRYHSFSSWYFNDIQHFVSFHSLIRIPFIQEPMRICWYSLSFHNSSACYKFHYFHLVLLRSSKSSGCWKAFCESGKFMKLLVKQLMCRKEGEHVYMGLSLYPHFMRGRCINMAPGGPK